MFSRGNRWGIRRIASDLLIFTLQINDMYYKENEQTKFYSPKASDRQFTLVFLNQAFMPSIHAKQYSTLHNIITNNPAGQPTHPYTYAFTIVGYSKPNRYACIKITQKSTYIYLALAKMECHFQILQF